MIITKTIERGYQNIQKDFLKCQLNEIFLCFFLLDYDFICNFLIKNAQLEPVIKSILDRTNIYQHTYDKKVYYLKRILNLLFQAFCLWNDSIDFAQFHLLYGRKVDSNIRVINSHLKIGSFKKGKTTGINQKKGKPNI